MIKVVTTLFFFPSGSSLIVPEKEIGTNCSRSPRSSVICCIFVAVAQQQDNLISQIPDLTNVCEPKEKLLSQWSSGNLSVSKTPMLHTEMSCNNSNSTVAFPLSFLTLISNVKQLCAKTGIFTTRISSITDLPKDRLDL